MSRTDEWWLSMLNSDESEELIFKNCDEIRNSIKFIILMALC